MSKKIGNKQLFTILIILIALYGISRYISNRKGENTFHTAIVPRIDSGKIVSVYIFVKSKKGHPIHLFKNGRKWMVSQDDITSIAEERSPNYIIDQLRQIDPDRLATNDVQQWKDYEVSDTAGTRIVMLGVNKDTMLDVIIGKFGFMPQQRKGISYVRINGQKEVYGIEGFLSMNIAEEFDSWRNRKIILSDYQSYKRLTFAYPADSGYSLQKDSTGKWRFDDGKIADSAGTANSIANLSHQNYGGFVNKFDTNAQPAMFTLKVESVPSGTFIVKAYPSSDTAVKYVVTSTLNPGSYFNGAKSNLFKSIFPGKKAFLTHSEVKKPASALKAVKTGKK